MSRDPYSLPGYDAWKTKADSDYWDDEPDDECWHEDYDVDILTGRATCDRCGFSWWQTDAEIASEIERIRAYDEWAAQQERPWNRFKEWLSRTRLASWFRRRKLTRQLGRDFDDDSEVPF